MRLNCLFKTTNNIGQTKMHLRQPVQVGYFNHFVLKYCFYSDFELTKRDDLCIPDNVHGNDKFDRYVQDKKHQYQFQSKLQSFKSCKLFSTDSYIKQTIGCKKVVETVKQVNGSVAINIITGCKAFAYKK